MLMTGPILRDTILTRMREASMHGFANYQYLTREGGKLKRVPEYDARVIRITAYHVSMGEPLGPLAELLRALPDCTEAVEHTDGGRDGMLRPRVEALFNRPLPWDRTP
jgi:hypothetical protein